MTGLTSHYLLFEKHPNFLWLPQVSLGSSVCLRRPKGSTDFLGSKKSIKLSIPRSAWLRVVEKPISPQVRLEPLMNRADALCAHLPMLWR